MEKSKLILAYDIAALPIGRTMKDISREFKEQGIVVWASKGNTNMSGRDVKSPPVVLDRETLEKVDGIKFIDVSDE